MLNQDQRQFFTDHGWLLLENVLTPEQCQGYVDALAHAGRTRRPIGYFKDPPEQLSVDNLVLYDDIFIDWLKLPGVIVANRELLGATLRLEIAMAHIKQPNADRHTRAGELNDPDTWNWHRGMRPKWGIFADDDDPSQINCAVLNNITYLTEVWPGNGSTAILDRSHRLEGNYQSLKERCEIVQPPVKAGGVVIMGETTIHTGVPILSEIRRYNMYYEFVPPWFGTHPHYDVPDAIVDRLADDELRELLAHPHYRSKGQYPVPAA